MVSSRRASREKSVDDRLQPRPEAALRRSRAFRGDAVDVAVGLVELRHDAVEIHRIGVARQHRKDFGEAGLLAVQFVDQAVGDGLLAHQVRGILLDRLDAADAHDGGRQQQQNHQAEAGEQHAEDVLWVICRGTIAFSVSRAGRGRSYPQRRLFGQANKH